MKLTATEIRAAVYVLRHHRQTGGLVTPSVVALSKRLESAVLQGEAASPWRQSDDRDDADLDHGEWIGSKLAAKLLGWSMRQIQRHAADLGGRKLGDGDRLYFPAHRVAEYANHLDDGNDRWLN